jgi:hypothetical protein
MFCTFVKPTEELQVRVEDCRILLLVKFRLDPCSSSPFHDAGLNLNVFLSAPGKTIQSLLTAVRIATMMPKLVLPVFASMK